MGEGRKDLQKHMQFYSPLQENLNGCDPLLFNFVFVGGGGLEGPDNLKGNWRFLFSTVSNHIV